MDKHRPKLHYTPKKGWINDPNGMVYHNGEYHLFSQHYPDDTIWGPMHWGHAVSRDLLHWEELDIALYPCEQGMIFSGSVAVDAAGRMAAIYTLHGDKERQGVAFSDDARNFVPYSGNPVIENPGIADFRDPKFFHVPGESCTRMVLAAGDRAHFYVSDDYISWEKTGEFGPEGNYIDGVWECPDVFPMKDEEGQLHWVMLMSMTPNVVQYFVGQFQNGAFVKQQDLGHAQLLYPGGDCYATVSYGNLPVERRILQSWMADWRYAKVTPTTEFRGAMGLPREVCLRKIDGVYRLVQNFTQELYAAAGLPEMIEEEQEIAGTLMIEAAVQDGGSFTLENDAGEQLVFGVDAEGNLYVDRSRSGVTDFFDGFGGRFVLPRYKKGAVNLTAVFDVSGLELCADGGLTSFAALVYPTRPYTRLRVQGAEGTIATIE